MAVCRHKLQRLFECMHGCLPLCAALRKPLDELADLHTMRSEMNNTGFSCEMYRMVDGMLHTSCCITYRCTAAAGVGEQRE
jgi:hypothetical protein